MPVDADARAELRAWIGARIKGIDPDEVVDDTPLFEGRHLKSLHVPDLILMLERLRGEVIDVTALQPGDFRDIDTICGRFLAELDSRGES